jgi:hypothetical protein
MDAKPVVPFKAFVQPEEPVSAAGKAQRRPVKATSYRWIDPEAIPRREFVYGWHLIRKFVSATVSPGGVGKTSLCTVEMLAMATGRDLLASGGRIVEPQRVWYLNLEDPLEEIRRQVQAAAIFYDVAPADIAGQLFIDSGRDQEFIIAETTKGGGPVICKPVVESIIAEIKKNQIDVVIIDPFVSSHQVSENDNGAMDLVVKQWGKIAEATNCAVHLIHHTRKQGGDEITAESSRGGKALVDGCRSVRVINRMTKAEAEKAGVENHRLYFRAYNDKANLVPPSETSDWYQIRGVNLRNGPNGFGDQIGVVSRWNWPSPFDDVTPSDLRNVQLAVSRGEWKASSQAEDWVGYCVAEVLGLDPSGDPEHKTRIASMMKTWLKNGAFKKVEKKDERDRKSKPFIEVGEWAE